MRSSGRATHPATAGLVVVLIACGIVSCGGAGEPVYVLRDADSVRVLDPSEVERLRSEAERSNAVGASNVAESTGSGDQETSDATGTVDDGAAGSDTIPLNEDDRPPELKLFEAFGEFRSCIEDAGETIRGDLQDPNNPAYQDPAYLELVQKCAARSDIVTVLQEVAATRASLTPDEIETRNEIFVLLKECLVDRGWTVETTTSASGLIEPTVFRGPNGSIDERDINQCLSEGGINDAIEEATGDQ